MKRFLQYTVEEALAGRGGELKESVLGMAVFDRGADYDPRLDPIVRVEARRLRAKLEEYYRQAGAGDPIRIEYERGSYAPVFRGHPSAPPQPAERTIAILPFSNLAPEAGNDYFSDGLTQELIHAMTRLPGLRVMAWNSAAALRQKGQRPEEIGRTLPVDNVLEGSVRWAGDRVRLTVRLVETSTGLYVWTETFDRRLRDLFEVQEELARAIATALEIRLVSGDRLRPRAANMEAYNLYLRGRHEWNRRTEEGLRQSLILFERAAQLDNRFALAYAGLADAYALLGDFGVMAMDVMPRAREAALRAIELDPGLAEPHCSIGFLSSVHDWDWSEGERHFRRSIELNPGYATARLWYGVDMLVLVGRIEEGIREIDVSCRLDPLNFVAHEARNYAWMLARRYAEAEAGYQRLSSWAPGFYKSYTGMGRTLAAQGRYREAIEMLLRGRELIGDVPSVLGALAHVHGLNGDTAEAGRLAAQVEEMSRRRHVSCVTRAMVSLGQRDRSAALDWLERAAAQKELPLAADGMHPAYDELRTEARFQALLSRMNLVR